MAKIPRFAEKGLVVASLLVSTGALAAWRSGNASVAEGGSLSDPLLQLIWLGIYSVTLLLLFALRKGAVKVVGRDKLSWLLLGIVISSTLWSTVPGTTLRRGMALAGTYLFGIYVATRYNLDEQLRLLAWTLGIIAILSLVVAIGMPTYGIDTLGKWRGIYTQRNILARLMVLSSMVFLLLALSIHKHRWIAWAMFGLSITLILLTTSKTALVSFLALLVLLVLYRALRFHYNLAVPLSIFGVLTLTSVGILLLSNSEILLKSLGKDATLTGRTELWDTVLEMIWKRPILGYGYGGFWTTNSNSPAAYVWNVIIWKPIHSHNGLLNLGLDVGLLGVSVFVLGFVLNTMRAISWVRLTKTAEGFWPLIYMTFMFVYNLSESSLVGQNDFFWIIYVAISFSKPIQNVQAGTTVYLSTQKQRLSQAIPPG